MIEGVTLLEHLENVSNQTGKVPEQLKQRIEKPHLISYVWDWFLELNEARENTGFGISRLSFREIQAWGELTKNFPTPYEVSVLKMLDSVFVQEVNKK